MFATQVALVRLTKAQREQRARARQAEKIEELLDEKNRKKEADDLAAANRKVSLDAQMALKAKMSSVDEAAKNAAELTAKEIASRRQAEKNNKRIADAAAAAVASQENVRQDYGQAFSFSQIHMRRNKSV